MGANVFPLSLVLQYALVALVLLAALALAVYSIYRATRRNGPHAGCNCAASCGTGFGSPQSPPATGPTIHPTLHLTVRGGLSPEEAIALKRALVDLPFVLGAHVDTAGGNVAVLLRDPCDAVMEARVRSCLSSAGFPAV